MKKIHFSLLGINFNIRLGREKSASEREPVKLDLKGTGRYKLGRGLAEVSFDKDAEGEYMLVKAGENETYRGHVKEVTGLDGPMLVLEGQKRIVCRRKDTLQIGEIVNGLAFILGDDYQGQDGIQVDETLTQSGDKVSELARIDFLRGKKKEGGMNAAVAVDMVDGKVVGMRSIQATEGGPVRNEPIEEKERGEAVLKAMRDAKLVLRHVVQRYNAARGGEAWKRRRLMKKWLGASCPGMK